MESQEWNTLENGAITHWIEIEFTNYCGLDCKVCVRKEAKDFGFISFETFTLLTDLISQRNCTHITIWWLWDAFLHKDLFLFIDYLFQKIPQAHLSFITKWQTITDKHLEKLKSYKENGFRVSISFSVFSLDETIHNHLTWWWNNYHQLMSIMKQCKKLEINYSVQFLLSLLTLPELEKFKTFANKTWIKYWISPIHNWWWKLNHELYKKLFNFDALKWYCKKRWRNDICEIFSSSHLYYNYKWESFPCSLSSLKPKWYVWKLWVDDVWKMYEKKSQLNYKDICANCFYFDYKTH
jgi:MoaA/NifB/PqqE/SkfB family radical SAM enzyme